MMVLEAKDIKSRSSPFKLSDASAFSPSFDCKEFDSNFQSCSALTENFNSFSLVIVVGEGY